MAIKNMTVLDVLNKFPETIPVFREYDRKYSTCLCCTSMLETIEMAAVKNKVDLKKLLADLQKVLNEGSGDDLRIDTN